MKIFLMPLALVLGLLTGCDSVPANRGVTKVNPANVELDRTRYNNFVEQRTQELQRMGGALAKEGAARSQAIEEANARYGTPPADVVWSWGKEADRAKQQAAFNDQLNKMVRDKKRD